MAIAITEKNEKWLQRYYKVTSVTEKISDSVIGCTSSMLHFPSGRKSKVGEIAATGVIIPVVTPLLIALCAGEIIGPKIRKGVVSKILKCDPKYVAGEVQEIREMDAEEIYLADTTQNKLTVRETDLTKIVGVLGNLHIREENRDDIKNIQQVGGSIISINGENKVVPLAKTKRLTKANI